MREWHCPSIPVQACSAKCRDSHLRQPSDLELHRPVPKKAIGAGLLLSDLWDQTGGTNCLKDYENRHH